VGEATIVASRPSASHASQRPQSHRIQVQQAIPYGPGSRTDAADANFAKVRAGKGREPSQRRKAGGRTAYSAELGSLGSSGRTSRGSGRFFLDTIGGTGTVPEKRAQEHLPEFFANHAGPPCCSGRARAAQQASASAVWLVIGALAARACQKRATRPRGRTFSFVPHRAHRIFGGGSDHAVFVSIFVPDEMSDKNCTIIQASQRRSRKERLFLTGPLLTVSNEGLLIA
jgi:hypothetical protein